LLGGRIGMDRKICCPSCGTAAVLRKIILILEFKSFRFIGTDNKQMTGQVLDSALGTNIL
jgi:hypothetical protein